MKIGFLYAGQGSQHAGMGVDLYEKYPAFRKVFDEASLDFDLKQVCFKDADGVINLTRYTQPCMVAFAAGMNAVLEEKGITPAAAAGLSLGEYSALNAAGVFDVDTAISVAAFRGAAMEKAAEGIDCAMVAMLGLDRDGVLAACREAADMGVVEACNFNCPGQIVISGEAAAVSAAAEIAKSKGAKRCIPLKVSGPFHTSLLKPAGDALREYFKTISFGNQRIPVMFNCLGRARTDNENIAELLERQVQSSVYLEDCIHAMVKNGINVFVEIGPGKALSGFVRKSEPGVPCFAVETVSDVETLLEKLEGAAK